MKLYGIDIFSTDVFDFCVNNGKRPAKETIAAVLEVVSALAKGRKKRKK